MDNQLISLDGPLSANTPSGKPPVIDAALDFIKHQNEITRDYERGTSYEYATAIPKEITILERNAYDLAIKVLCAYFESEIKSYEKEK